MIIDTLANADKYSGLHPRFAAAFAFLRRPGLATLPLGRHTIEGDDLFVILSRSRGRSRSEARLEAHRQYIDIQLVISGIDEMGWRPRASCGNPSVPYSPEKDIEFFDDAPETWVATPAGAFCLFFPDDAHAPLVGEGEIHKAVVKVAV